MPRDTARAELAAQQRAALYPERYVIEGTVTDTCDDYWPFVTLGTFHPASGPRGDLGPGSDDPLQAALRPLEGKRVRITIRVLPEGSKR